jgi:hypothetical protein
MEPAETVALHDQMVAVHLQMTVETFALASLAHTHADRSTALGLFQTLIPPCSCVAGPGVDSQCSAKAPASGDKRVFEGACWPTSFSEVSVRPASSKHTFDADAKRLTF